MLLYFIAVPVAFLVAQGFWTLVAFAWTQHRLNLIAARHRLVQRVHWLRTVTRQRGEIYVFSERFRVDVRQLVPHLP